MPWYVPQKYYDMFPLDVDPVPKVTTTDLDDIPAGGHRWRGREGDQAIVSRPDNGRTPCRATSRRSRSSTPGRRDCSTRWTKVRYKDNTIVVLWGDHGWHLGEKQHWRKFALWEEATRAPALVVVPGVTKAATKCDTPVDSMGMYPTLCDLCGLKTPEHMEGKSIVTGRCWPIRR